MTYCNVRTVSRQRRRSGAKPLAIVLVAMALSFAFAGSAALAAMRSQIDRGHAGFGSSPAHLAFTDGAGHVLYDAHIDAADPAPGAATSRIPIGIWNQGLSSAEYEVSAEHLRSPAGPLVNGPQVTVTDPSGVVVYSGGLSEMTFSGPSLEPGDSRTYLISLSWPHGLVSGDLEGGRSLSFDLSGVAEPANR